MKNHFFYAILAILVFLFGSLRVHAQELQFEPAQVYTVQKGDTLWSIAERYLGEGKRYTEIAELNTNIISNPRKIYPGAELTLPADAGLRHGVIELKESITAQPSIVIGGTYDVVIEADNNYQLVAEKNIAYLDNQGRVVARGIGFAAIWSGRTGWLLEIAKDGDIILYPESKDYIWDEREVSSIKSSNELVAKVSKVPGGVEVVGVGKGHSTVTIIYADGEKVVKGYSCMQLFELNEARP